MLRTSGGNVKKPYAVVDPETRPMVISIIPDFFREGSRELSTISKGFEPLCADSMVKALAGEANSGRRSVMERRESVESKQISGTCGFYLFVGIGSNRANTLKTRRAKNLKQIGCRDFTKNE